MKYLKFLLFMSCGVLFFNSCEKVDGKTTVPAFSPKDVTVDEKGGEVILKAKNKVGWWLSDFKINGKLIIDEEWDNIPGLKYEAPFKKNPISPNLNYTEINRIEFEDWFVWEKEDNQTIRIMFEENESEAVRTIEFTADVGNGSDLIRIIQQDKE